MSLANRFQLVVDQLASGNKKQFAELTGKSASHIYKICRGMSRPSMAYLQNLHSEFRIDITWLLTGEHNNSGDPTGYVSNKDQVQAPMFDIQASAGAGAMVDLENVSDYFTFNKGFLSQQLGVSSDQLAFVTISGDSMLPTLNDGDQVLVDLSNKRVKKDSIYLLNTETGLVAKRLRNLNAHTLEVISDNPDYDTWQMDLTSGDLTNGELSSQQSSPVVGKIVWSAKAL